MEKFIGHVISARTFKQLSDALSGRKRRSTALKFGQPSSTIDIRHNTAELQISHSVTRVLPINNFDTCPTTRENAASGPSMTELLPQAREGGNACNRTATKLSAMEGSESNSNMGNKISTLSYPWNATVGLTETEDHPPVTARYLKIYTFPGDHGEMSCALSSTKTLVWQLNKILYCEPAIAECVKEINTTKAQRTELKLMFVQLDEQLQQATNAEDYNQTLETLQGVEDIAVRLQEQERKAEQKLLELREELDWPRAQLFLDLKKVLQINNLLEDFKKNDDLPNDQMRQAGNFEEKAPTPSEAAQNAAEQERDAAIETITHLERRLQDARLTVENWNIYYDEQYRDYCRCAAERTLERTKSQFDVILLIEEQQATGDLIRAENDFEDGKELARRIGIVLNDEDQESNFSDNIEDGYRESMEADFINNVDRSFIKRWMSEEEDRPHHSTNCDNWDSKTVDFGDSISVVAEGRERKRIDRWRSICEQLKTEALGSR